MLTQIELNTPALQHCFRGMEAEMQGAREMASAHYQAAWDQHASPFEGCVAAHYLARVQPSQADCLHWNQIALQEAEASMADQVVAFWPSLYLNLGQAYADLAQPAAAQTAFTQAWKATFALPDLAYGEMLRGGIQPHLIAVPEEPLQNMPVLLP